VKAVGGGKVKMARWKPVWAGDNVLVLFHVKQRDCDLRLFP
jgi:hypothetical protein